MNRYTFKYKNQAGATVKRFITAPMLSAAIQQLPRDIREVRVSMVRRVSA